MKKDNLSADNTGFEMSRKVEGKLALQVPAEVVRGDIDIQKLLHELQAHQVELEIQYKELLQAKADLLSEKKWKDELVDWLIKTDAEDQEESFFNRLARFLAKTLEMDFICIDRLEGDGLTASTLAVWSDGHFEDNVIYSLKDTPCGDVVGKGVCCIPTGVSQLFPRDQVLQDLKAESYVGVTLWSHSHKPIGLIAAIRRQPLEELRTAESMLHLVGIRAAAEIERQDALVRQAELEKQVLQAQKLECLGVLAGGIAHDFNNILTVITCNCSLMQQRPDLSAELIPEIEFAAGRAADLCRQMLTYAGKTSYTMAKIRMESLLGEMIQMLRSSISPKVKLIYDVVDDIPPIMGEASQLRQIILNLVINSSEAVGEKEGKIIVLLSKSDIEEGQTRDYLGAFIKPGCYVCLEVSDNGCGMDDQTIQHVFDPFFTTKFTGRGLGMSAVLGIITGHQGALQFASQPGQGTTFRIYLPALAIEARDHQVVPQKGPEPWQGSGTILLVDDEVMLLTVASALLEEMGFAVIEATNGIEALEQYQRNSEKIRLVITDIGMPIMDGYQLIIELKKINPQLPILICSGFAEMDVTSNVSKEHIAGLVSKPYSIKELQDVLKSVMGDDGKTIP